MMSEKKIDAPDTPKYSNEITNRIIDSQAELAWKAIFNTTIKGHILPVQDVEFVEVEESKPFVLCPNCPQSDICGNRQQCTILIVQELNLRMQSEKK